MCIPLDDEERPLDALPAPFLGAGVEVVGDDVRGGDEDVGDGGVEAAQHVEVERPRALRVRREVRGHLRAAAPAPCHGPRRKP